MIRFSVAGVGLKTVQMFLIVLIMVTHMFEFR